MSSVTTVLSRLGISGSGIPLPPKMPGLPEVSNIKDFLQGIVYHVKGMRGRTMHSLAANEGTCFKGPNTSALRFLTCMKNVFM